MGKWDRWYALLTEPLPYGTTRSYLAAAEWLAPCELIEDWGCGPGWFAHLLGRDRVVGVDGSQSPYADVVMDLTRRRSQTPGLLLRHVLEHDWRWQTVLSNALASFTQRAAVVFFIAPGEGPTEDLMFEEDPGVPNLRISADELASVLLTSGCSWSAETLPAEAGATFGPEVIIRCERGAQ